MAYRIGIDYGAKYIGLALVDTTTNAPLWMSVITVEKKPIADKLKQRSTVRRTRRTKKAKKRRLSRLRQALTSVGCDAKTVDALLLFSKKRGFGYEEKESHKDLVISVSREQFLSALDRKIDSVCSEEARDRIKTVCRRHLNPQANNEVRPARWNNRNTSKCKWEKCTKNVPRTIHARKERLQQAIHAWLIPFYRQSSEPQSIRQWVDDWISCTVADSSDYSSRLSELKRYVLSLPTVSRDRQIDAFRDNWDKHYKKNLTQIITDDGSGRTVFCREHSVQYVEYLLAGKVAPQKTAFSLGDVGRVEQKIFSNLWRYIECRLLPLLPDGEYIEAVTVEKNAFDMLRGYRPKRGKDGESIHLNDEYVTRLYQQGPKYGFNSTLDMLVAEFGGRCAYCGREGTELQVEHIFPQHRAVFDAYLNTVPACRSCNAFKGGRTIAEAGMTIHPDAYGAFEKYVSRYSVNGFKCHHPLHDTKKGFLKRMCPEKLGSGRAFTPLDEEAALAMVLRDIANACHTQQFQRPLAQYIAQQLSSHAGHECKILHQNGRITAFYRDTLIPDYVKETDDLRNHAIDAWLCGCDLPSLSGFRDCRRISASELLRWRDRVSNATPLLTGDIPSVCNCSGPRIKYFESEFGEYTCNKCGCRWTAARDGRPVKCRDKSCRSSDVACEACDDGYVAIDLCAFNWNSKNQSGYGLDPVGKTTRGDQKRSPAKDFHEELKAAVGKKNQKDVHKLIDKVLASGLRSCLLADPEHADAQLLKFLRKQTRTDNMADRPSDLERKRQYLAFCSGETDDIPPFIGITLKKAGGGFEIARSNGSVVYQHYHSDKTQCLYVGYPHIDGQIDRMSPVVFKVSQIYRVSYQRQNAVLTLPDDSPLLGRPLGARVSEKQFMRQWRAAFADLCKSLGVVELFKVSQGCVIEKSDGTLLQLRNFNTAEPWMKSKPFNDIVRVYRSPLVVIEQKRRYKKETTDI